MPESLANASANLKKFMRWPHKGDSPVVETSKPAATQKATAESKVTVPRQAPQVVASSQAPAPAVAESPSHSTSAAAAPEGAEFNAAFASDQPAPTAVATSDSVKSSPTVVAAETTAAPPGSWDWTTATQSTALSQPTAASTKTSKVVQAEAVQSPAAVSAVAEAKTDPRLYRQRQRSDTGTGATAGLSESTQTVAAVAAFAPVTVTPATVTPEAAAPAPVTAAIATPEVKPSEAVSSRTAVVAQMPESMPDDRPKISTPIETTETHTFSEPAQMVCPVPAPL